MDALSIANRQSHEGDAFFGHHSPASHLPSGLVVMSFEKFGVGIEQPFRFDRSALACKYL